MADDITDATKEAFATAPEEVRLWHTLEFYHSSWASTQRIVKDTKNQDFMLESTAPRNAGTVQTFTAFEFDARLPKRDNAGRQQLEIVVDGVSLEMANLLMSTDHDLVPVDVIYRLFCSSEPLQPGRVNSLTVKSVSIDEQRVTVSCLYADYVNRRFPRKRYNSTDFPGLFK